jgi:hypothetical protein
MRPSSSAHQSENTLNQASVYQDNNIFDSSRRDDNRLPEIIEEEIDVGYGSSKNYHDQ